MCVCVCVCVGQSSDYHLVSYFTPCLGSTIFIGSLWASARPDLVVSLECFVARLSCVCASTSSVVGNVGLS